MRAAASALLLVALGGAAGSAGRATITLALPGVPLAATLLVNVVGAFVLAALMTVLDVATPRQQIRQRRLRLIFGTGFCGGFTTYSAVALQAGELVRDSAPLTAAGYALATLVLGALASLAGLTVAGRAVAQRDATERNV